MCPKYVPLHTALQRANKVRRPNMCARCFYVCFFSSHLHWGHTLRIRLYLSLRFLHSNFTITQRQCKCVNGGTNELCIYIWEEQKTLQSRYICVQFFFFTLHLTDISWLHKPIRIIKLNSVRILDTFLVRRLVGHRFDYILIVITSDCQ